MKQFSKIFENQLSSWGVRGIYKLETSSCKEKLLLMLKNILLSTIGGKKYNLMC